VSKRQDRQKLREHLGVGLLVFSSAAVSNWRVLASNLRVAEQIRWGQGSGSLCCRSVFCEIKDKKILWSLLVSVRGVWRCQCTAEVLIWGHGSNCSLCYEAWGSCSPSMWSQVALCGLAQQPSSCSKSGK
jgi:hypothetical protein